MSEISNQTAERKRLEGNVFYPTGCIVIALSHSEDAEALSRRLADAGFAGDQCTVTPAEDVVKAASQETESPSLVASLGSSIHLRTRQLELARAGCIFMQIKAPNDEAKSRALRVLADVPVRYAVHYHRLIVEDLIDRLPAAEDAVKSGSLSDT
jgi:hypothetical protein